MSGEEEPCASTTLTSPLRSRSRFGGYAELHQPGDTFRARTGRSRHERLFADRPAVHQRTPQRHGFALDDCRGGWAARRAEHSERSQGSEGCFSRKSISGRASGAARGGATSCICRVVQDGVGDRVGGGHRCRQASAGHLRSPCGATQNGRGAPLPGARPRRAFRRYDYSEKESRRSSCPIPRHTASRDEECASMRCAPRTGGSSTIRMRRGRHGRGHGHRFWGTT